MARLWDQLRFFQPGWLDLLEILIVAVLLYRLLLIIRRTRAWQALIGVLMLAGIYFLAGIFNLQLIQSILSTFFQFGVIAALVVFAPGLRMALSRLGQHRLFRLVTPLQESQVIEEILDGVERLARSKIGAIVAVEQEIDLDEYAQTGSPIRARVSAEMLATIFTPYSPLHDGAVIVVGDEIVAAGVILPLTQYALSDKSLGTRHRAAIGLSEETDALVIVVSEETSRVSVALQGRLERDIDTVRLRSVLEGGVQERGGSRASAAKVG
jgi:diadenylate cyclase